ncbi:MAG: hypothetical protein OER85_06090 [Gammaproteobacteria bacterium]|nr:hypothetical protein [Gammaproteobacteria bacterium]
MTELPGKRFFLGLLFGVAAIMPGFAADQSNADDAQVQDANSASADSQHAQMHATRAWNASVVGHDRPNAAQWSASVLRFRVYDGVIAAGPIIDRRVPAYAVDVNAQFKKCADGSLQISTLDIGGLLYEPADHCAHADWPGNFIGMRDGNTSSSANGTQGPGVASGQTPGKPIAGDKVIRCDPATWSCRTIGP